MPIISGNITLGKEHVVVPEPEIPQRNAATSLQELRAKLIREEMSANPPIEPDTDIEMDEVVVPTIAEPRVEASHVPPQVPRRSPKKARGLDDPLISYKQSSFMSDMIQTDKD
jgi:hypothetical protein